MPPRSAQQVHDEVGTMWRGYVPEGSLDQGFFDAGGNSVDAVLLMNQCETAFGVPFPVEDFLAGADLATVAEAIATRLGLDGAADP